MTSQKEGKGKEWGGAKHTKRTRIQTERKNFTTASLSYLASLAACICPTFTPLHI